MIEKINLLLSILSEALLVKREIGLTLAGCDAHTLCGLLSAQVLVASSYAEGIHCVELRLTMRARDTSLETCADVVRDPMVVLQMDLVVVGV